MAVRILMNRGVAPAGAVYVRKHETTWLVIDPDQPRGEILRLIEELLDGEVVPRSWNATPPEAVEALVEHVEG